MEAIQLVPQEQVFQSIGVQIVNVTVPPIMKMIPQVQKKGTIPSQDLATRFAHASQIAHVHARGWRGEVI